MKLKNSLIIISLFVFYCLLFIVSDIQAEYTFQVDYPVIQGESPTGELASYIKYIYLLSLGLVGLAALGALVYGGFMYMLSGTITSKEEAKSWIKGAISGLLLALAAYLILNTINPELVNWQLVLPDLPK